VPVSLFFHPKAGFLTPGAIVPALDGEPLSDRIAKPIWEILRLFPLAGRRVPHVSGDVAFCFLFDGYVAPGDLNGYAVPVGDVQSQGT